MAEKKLNEDQRVAFKSIKRFIDHPAADTLVIKGCAGTGKTFLMQHLARWLTEKKKPFKMLASTGRAAAVLKGKSGFKASTVHSELYRFSRVDGDHEDLTEEAPIEKYGQMTLQFALRPPDAEKTIYIVDESSMLSSAVQKDKTTRFGSGSLLSDFFQASKNGKLIFVGDPCQLPPIEEGMSPALDLTWLTQQKRTAGAITLEKIERTNENNDVLILANSLRNMSEAGQWSQFPKLPARHLQQVRLSPTNSDLFKKYIFTYKEKGVNAALAIAQSNKVVNQINRAFRRDLYGQIDLPLQRRDVLLVIQNNNKVPLTNGDFVRVTFIGNTITHAGFHFIEVRVHSVTTDDQYELLLSLDLLSSPELNFNSDQQKLLMVDFSRRMKQKGIKPNSEEYKARMMNDPYLNCLKAKYGYAVTCHKAQGGEWDQVFLFLDKKMYGMPKPELFRWWYTAVTRTKNELNLVDDWWIS